MDLSHARWTLDNYLFNDANVADVAAGVIADAVTDDADADAFFT